MHHLTHHASPSKSGFPSNRGFTLIELLVTITIIAVLAALSFMIAPNIKASAHKAVCASNVRNQLVAFQAYASDNGNKYYWPAASSGADNAPQFLYPDYLGNVETFLCPATNNRVRLNAVNRFTGKLIDLENNAVNAEDSSGGHSYEYFGYFSIPESEVPGGAAANPFYKRKKPNHPFREPHETLLVLDGDDSGINNLPDSTNNHRDSGWNWGFADGHVRWVTKSETNEMLVRCGNRLE
jgi:prepilin-type N-terminal cleavage/methylation domain-containing protein/prepilin-type processing-associated H-X9-DG protein